MNTDLILAHGKALALLAAILERGGVLSASEFANMLGIFAVTVSEADPTQGDILAVWASIVKEAS